MHHLRPFNGHTRPGARLNESAGRLWRTIEPTEYSERKYPFDQTLDQLSGGDISEISDAFAAIAGSCQRLLVKCLNLRGVSAKFLPIHLTSNTVRVVSAHDLVTGVKDAVAPRARVNLVHVEIDWFGHSVYIKKSVDDNYIAVMTRGSFGGPSQAYLCDGLEGVTELLQAKMGELSGREGAVLGPLAERTVARRGDLVRHSESVALRNVYLVVRDTFSSDSVVPVMEIGTVSHPELLDSVKTMLGAGLIFDMNYDIRPGYPPSPRPSPEESALARYRYRWVLGLQKTAIRKLTPEEVEDLARLARYPRCERYAKVIKNLTGMDIHRILAGE